MYKEGDFFGEGSFFTGNTRRVNIKSGGFIKLLCIKRQDFVNLLK